MKTVGSYEAKTHLPEILRRVEAGETIIITRHGRPIAKVAPMQDLPKRDNPWDAMFEACGNFDKDFIEAVEEGHREMNNWPMREVKLD